MPMTFVPRPSMGRNCTGSRKEPEPQVSDEQWLLIADLFAEPEVTSAGGRPRVDARLCLKGVLWVLVTGARWKDLPNHFPSPSTCWRRFREWTESGVWQKAWSRLLCRLDRTGQINWEESIGDGTFSPAKKGRRRRQNEARQRYQDYALGRQPRHASGGDDCQCFGSRSESDRADAEAPYGTASAGPPALRSRCR